MAITPKEEIRDYKISDDAMLEDGNTTVELFHDDLADFTGYDAELDAQFEADWRDAIEAAELTTTDEQYGDTIITKTEEVEEKMEAARTKYSDVKYVVVEKAFPKNKGVQKEFGLDDYNDARDSQVKLRKFMTTMHKMATKYSGQLIAEGFTQIKIDEIKTLGDALEASDTEQEVTIRGRITTTQDRIIKHNAAWAFRRRVSAASKNLYATNYAKLQQYLLPPSEESADAFSVTGIITSSNGGTPIENAGVEVLNTAITGNSDEFGKYGVKMDEGSHSLRFTAAGHQSKQIDNVVVVQGVPVTLDVVLDVV